MLENMTIRYVFQEVCPRELLGDVISIDLFDKYISALKMFHFLSTL